MVYKQIRPQEVQQFTSRQVVSHSGKAHPGWNAEASAKGTEEGCFADTVTPPILQHPACLVMFGEIKRVIRVIPDVVSDGIIDGDSKIKGLVLGVFGYCPGISLDIRVMTVDNFRGLQVLVEV